MDGAKVSWSGTQDSEDLRTNYQLHNDAVPFHAGQNEGNKRWEAHKAGGGCEIRLGILTRDIGW